MKNNIKNIRWYIFLVLILTALALSLVHNLFPNIAPSFFTKDNIGLLFAVLVVTAVVIIRD
jgi:hypothetical protein